MTIEELLTRRLQGQHLLKNASSRTVVQDLCGVQAQFLSHALHSLKIRSGNSCTDGLVKSWTNRGTMHLFSVDDLPLFLHTGRSRFLRPVDTLDSDAFVCSSRKAYFAELITDGISRGRDTREELKLLCQHYGMTDAEAKSLFDPWGGLVRALCESGRICHKVQEKKSYQLCPAFEPMSLDAAEQEMARRYFSNFGPATIKDGAYFFRTTQNKVKQWLKQLPVCEFSMDGKAYYYIERKIPDAEIPECLFLAGFDQLLLGYEKSESLFLQMEHIGEIFNRSGIVRPAVLVNGSVAGWRNHYNRKLTVTLFSDCNKNAIMEAAFKLWPEIEKIAFL